MQYQPRTKPTKHQAEELELHAHKSVWGRLWEQGTGKTKQTIDEIAIALNEGVVDAILVVAPNGVHRNWLTDEMPKHMPEDVLKRIDAMIYKSQSAGTKWHKQQLERTLASRKVPMLLFSYDGLMTDRGKQAAWRLLKSRKVFYILDESHHIKTPGAKKTKSIVASGRYAQHKRILTGTPVSKGPFDVYSQIKFLDENFWNDIGCGTFQAFKTRFGVWEKGFNRKIGKEYPVLVSYRDLDLLKRKLQTITSRVLKDDVLDLPPKTYPKLYYEMTPAQSEIYERLKGEYMYDHGDGRVTNASLAIVRLLRFQQVLCGYLPFEDEDGNTGVELIPGKNPRMDTLHEAVTDLGHQFIVWARFTMDIDMIADRLRGDGLRVGTYYGKNSDDDNERSKLGFNAGEFDVFVGNPAKGAEGLTLLPGKSTWYYNNSFRLIHRLQSEDRNHRMGQTVSIPYTDLICQDSVDEHYVDNLLQKVDVASQVTGDRLKQWLEQGRL